ncbi:hypothetical protein DEIPH_ctg035orf0024 [Deinococcus phoenicis]|uniref:Uncharacterized protein n=1 Tax=Deinococcus phoenicis TaxID=1476583 RepID=A0A016QP04_9DEIO|nr:hypothetical protein [Deinococcus phoenicis]EYB67582.1 hypothetical protein DEIPH_ctg035orf0024 [Deinococcus phoenicis]
MTRFSFRALLDRIGGSGFKWTGAALAGPSHAPRRREEGEDGIGVPVPVGPRPRRGGAQAQPPREEEEAVALPPLRG